MKRHAAIAAFFALMVLPLNTAAEPRPLKVGAILPLSGKAASAGKAMQNGMIMAYESLSQEVKSAFELSYDDDASESKQTAAAVRKLMADGEADAVITAFSNAGNTAVPITEAEAFPLISLALDRSITDGKKAAFRFFLDIEDLSRAAANEAARRGYRSIATITTVHEGNVAMRNGFFAAAEEKFKHPLDRDLQLSEADFNTVVVPFQSAAGIDAIGVFLHPAHCGVFIRNLRSRGVILPVFTLGGFEDSGVRAAAGDGLKGGWYAAAAYSPDFLPAYHKRFPGDSSYGAAFGHDAILILAEAAKRSIHRDSLAAYLRSAKLSGGATVSAEADGKNGFRFPVVIKTVGEDGVD